MAHEKVTHRLIYQNLTHGVLKKQNKTNGFFIVYVGFLGPCLFLGPMGCRGPSLVLQNVCMHCALHCALGEHIGVHWVNTG